MSIFKRGGVYWYKFMWKGERIRESTRQGNDKIARQMEAAHRTSLARARLEYATRNLYQPSQNSAPIVSSLGPKCAHHGYGIALAFDPSSRVEPLPARNSTASRAKLLLTT